jgi:redox-sensitive bicupin YhaK (pirin superfamily)
MTMITIRPAAERGRTEAGWLDSQHTFSFGEYFDPQHMGFRALRVINEDRVVPGAGFPTHGHRDMEIVTYVLDGAIAHKDSLGTGSVIRPGEVQRMTAGTGIRHSEFNHSPNDKLHFLQIWILPEKTGLAPGYEQKSFARQPGALRLVGSRDGREGSITVHQDVNIHAGVLRDGDEVEFTPAPDRHVWLQVARGLVTVNGRELKSGDGAAISGERSLKIVGRSDAEIVLFDLA